jgi:hypothetical protein
MLERNQIMEDFECQAKKFELYPIGKRKLLLAFKLGGEEQVTRMKGYSYWWGGQGGMCTDWGTRNKISFDN